MIKVEELQKSYKTKDKEIVASNRISLEFKNNGIYFVIGKSGCGKTTFLNVLSGLDKYDGGHVYVDGRDIGKLDDCKMDEYRNLDIGVIFQDYNLIPELSVYDNLSLVLKIQEMNYLEIEKEIEDALEYVDLKGYEKRKISELSGGERQRIGVARAIIKKPKIIFADEPTGNLDSKTSEKIFEILSEISKNHIVIIVSHDKEAASKYADYIIEISDGKILKYEDNTIYKEEIKYSFGFYKDNKLFNNEELDKESLIKIMLNAFQESEEKKLTIVNFSKKETEVKLEIKRTNESCIEEKKRPKKLIFRDRLKLSLAFLKKK